MNSGAKLICRDTGRIIAERVVRCETTWERTRGLIGRTIEVDECMWIAECNMIHTCFMGYPIDVVFVDADLRVVRLCPNLAPWRVTPGVAGASAVLESRAGWIEARGMYEGQTLECLESGETTDD